MGVFEDIFVAFTVWRDALRWSVGQVYRCYPPGWTSIALMRKGGGEGLDGKAPRAETRKKAAESLSNLSASSQAGDGCKQCVYPGAMLNARVVVREGVACGRGKELKLCFSSAGAVVDRVPRYVISRAP